VGTQSIGQRLINEGDYAGAISALRLDEAENPASSKTKRDLGIALYLSDNYSIAKESLLQARSINPDDVQTVFYLGRVYDKLEDVDGAIEAYAAYIGLGGEGSAEVQARLQDLSNQKATAEIRANISAEHSLSVSSIPENTIAVPSFLNVMDDVDLAPLSRGLAVVLMTDLSRVKELQVLERQRLSILLSELDLAHPRSVVTSPDALDSISLDTVQEIKTCLMGLVRPSSQQPYYKGAINNQADGDYLEAIKAFQADHDLVVDGIIGAQTKSVLRKAIPSERQRSVATGSVINTDTAPRLGALLGAKRFVQGSFLPLNESQIQLGANLIEISAGDLNPSGPPISGPLQRLLYLEKELVYQILGYLDIEPTDEERKQIDRVPTEDFLAFLAYCRGLEFEAEGLTSQAAAAYGEAVRIDPGFAAAAESEQISGISQPDQDALDNREATQATHGEESVADRQSRLDNTGEQTGLGPGPEGEQSDEQDNPYTDVNRLTEMGPSTVTIIIRTLPPRR